MLRVLSEPPSRPDSELQLDKYRSWLILTGITKAQIWIADSNPSPWGSVQQKAPGRGGLRAGPEGSRDWQKRLQGCRQRNSRTPGTPRIGKAIAVEFHF